MDLLIYFAFPIATIIISVVLQKLLRNPTLVAAFVFAVFLIVTFTAFDESFLIATLAYTLIALVTAFIVDRLCPNNNQEEDDETDTNENSCGCTRTIPTFNNYTYRRRRF